MFDNEERKSERGRIYDSLLVVRYELHSSISLSLIELSNANYKYHHKKPLRPKSQGFFELLSDVLLSQGQGPNYHRR